jgi:hypothetical protein
MAYDITGNADIRTISSAITNYPFTIALWARIDNVNANRNICALSTASGTGTGYHSIECRTTSQFAAVSSTNAVGRASSPVVNLNEWYSVVGVFRSVTNRQCYANAVGGTVNTTSSNFTPQTDLVTVGRAISNGTSPLVSFDGKIAEVAFWNVALNDDEIKSLSKGFKPSTIRTNSLIFYYPLIRTTQEVIENLPQTITNPGNLSVFEHPQRIG